MVSGVAVLSMCLPCLNRVKHRVSSMKVEPVVVIGSMVSLGAFIGIALTIPYVDRSATYTQLFTWISDLKSVLGWVLQQSLNVR